MKDIQFCIDKSIDIQKDIDSLKLNNIVIKRRGGTTTSNLDLEIEFHKKRVDLLKWAEISTEEEIQTKINYFTNLLPEELKIPIHYISNRLPNDIYEIYCFRELLYKVVK